MKKINKRVVSKICLTFGVSFFVIGILALFSWQWSINLSVKKLEVCVQTIKTLIPTPQNTVLEERRDNNMSVLDVDGNDFVGILEMPRHESELPISAEWGHLTKYPCKFSGSIYNSTMQIGVTTQKGQYDFYREISVGDTVFFTDMEGNRYSYKVNNLRYEKHADQTTLNREKSSLTIFIKNVYDFEYLIVFCEVVN